MIKTEILLNGKYLDLIDDVSMPLTYQIADIKNPSAKNTNFSKTITLPGTAINNKIFAFIWDTNVSVTSSGTTNFSPTFNPNKKADVQILYDGAEVFKGFMKLDRIKVLADYKIEYDVTCFGKLKDLFLSLGEKTLADINLSKYNHNYTRDIQIASWDNYIYKNGVTVAFNKGDGYVYPMIDYALNNNTDWKTEHFFPAMYYKTLIHEIITQAGFKYDGAIFNDNDFKSLIVGYGSGNLKLSNTQVEDRTFQASSTSTQTFVVADNFPINNVNNPAILNFQDDTTAPNADIGNNYNTSISRYVAPKNGSYSFTADLKFRMQHKTFAATTNFNTFGGILLGAFALYKNGTMLTHWNLRYNGTPLTSVPYIDSSNGGFTIVHPASVTKNAYTISLNVIFNQQVYLNSNDYVELKFYEWNGTTTQGTNIVNIYGENPILSEANLEFLSGSIFKCEMASSSVMEGDMVEMSNLYGNTIKQKDFISTFFKLFNIYTETDKYDSNLLHFETRPDFYASSGTIRNWDNKLDYSQEYEVLPMGNLDARTYLYKFKDDTDFWNEYYKKKYLETYGQKKYDVDNDWLSNTNTNEIIFSPTPLVDRLNDDKIIPRIINVNNNGQAVPISNNGSKAINLRLLYYGGVKSTLNNYNYIASSGTISKSNYAYAGHLDNIDYPNYDVNFGIPIEVYYTTQSYTNNNLFNKYYKQFIEEITNKDSKIFKGKFHLTAVDIARLNFRDLFYFHGDYWILNKIYDYNPIEVNKTTTCEFIKLKGGVPFIPTSGTINGGSKPVGTGEVYPTFNDSIPRDSNIFDSNVLISGSNNIINSAVEDSLITGSNNRISGNNKRITLINSSGTNVLPDAERIAIINSSGTNVYPLVKNVTIINTNDINIDTTYNNKTIINGITFGEKQIISSSGTYTFDGTEHDAFAIFEKNSVNISAYLPFPAQIKNGYTLEVKYANTAAVLELYIQSDTINAQWSPGDGTTATKLRFNPGDAFKFTYYDTVWYIH